MNAASPPTTAAPPTSAVGKGRAELPAQNSGNEPMGTGSALLVLSTAVLWGATAVANQFALDSMPPLYLGFARFALAGLFMIAWCFFERAPLGVRRNQWGPTLLMSLLLCLQIGTFNFGNARSNSSHASILVNSYIFWVMAYEFLIHRTFIPSRLQLLGLVLAAAGSGCLFLATEQAMPEGVRDVPTLLGDSVLALSGVILAVKVLYTKHCVRTMSPGTLIMWHDFLGGLMMLGASWLVGETWRAPMTRDSWIALLFSGLIVSGFCFGAHALLLRRHGASQVSVFSFCTPIFGVALAVWLRGDQLSFWLIFSGALTAAGIFLVNYVPKKATA
ncbi:DMT family transporter [Planctomicrobium sp. SH664]|uniref:DMT family transporter n=1 Tax=Planctomicrobium sp. SH664 TaxID=3448125 RepID=UPI003F5C8DAC